MYLRFKVFAGNIYRGQLFVHFADVAERDEHSLHFPEGGGCVSISAILRIKKYKHLRLVRQTQNLYDNPIN